MLNEALRFMWYDKPKLAGILFGIVICIFLIGQQLGILTSIIGNISVLVDNNPQYIWVTSDKAEQIGNLPRMDMRVGRELYSVPGVRLVNPIVIAGGSIAFADGTKAAVTLIGSQGPDFKGGPWNVVVGTKHDMVPDGAIITDQYDANLLNNIQVGDRFELNRKRAYLAGQTRGVRGFGAAYAFTTIERARSAGGLSASNASAFLVEYDARFTPDSVVRLINRTLPDVRAWTAQGLSAQSVQMMIRTSGIVLSFGLLVIFALIAGCAIVGLTLYSSVNDRIRDYGTIKAIGGSNGLIRRLILTQAAIYAVVGFGLAYGLLLLFKLGTGNTGLVIQYSPTLLMALVGVTVFIALLGSLFGLRKITRLEPVQIFRM